MIHECHPVVIDLFTRIFGELTRLSQLAVKHPSNGRISGGVVPQGRHHRMDGDYAIGMPSVVILGGGWSGKLILSR